MRCLFCKQDSSETKSVEHIIPESLGNKTFILPLGFVCDKCNNYFARKVEKQFLEQYDIKLIRFQQDIPNKKNKIPTINGVFDKSIVKMCGDVIDGRIIHSIDMPEELIKRIKNNELNKLQLILPAYVDDHILENNSIVSRFLAKVALEMLAYRLNSLDYLIDSTNYDLIRNHARFGTIKEWPCNIDEYIALINNGKQMMEVFLKFYLKVTFYSRI